MKFFTKKEIIGLILIFAVVFSLTFRGLVASQRRSRDAQRRADLGSISDALHAYQEEFGFFPPDEDGKIKACKGGNFDEVVRTLSEQEEFDRNLFFSALKGCEYGRDSLRDVTDDSYSPYLATIPSDPHTADGITYLYLSNANRFQIFAFLEGESDEDEYNPGVVERNLNCGTRICSVGKSSGDTPLEISIEEYEQILMERQKTGNQ